MQDYTKDQLGNSFRNEIFVGLDVDKASISFTVRDKDMTLRSLRCLITRKACCHLLTSIMWQAV